MKLGIPEGLFYARRYQQTSTNGLATKTPQAIADQRNQNLYYLKTKAMRTHSKETQSSLSPQMALQILKKATSDS
jgi:hypothetical protein